MAKGRKTGGRNFKPGNKANPKGRPQTPKDIKALYSSRQVEIKEFIAKYANMTELELRELVKDPKVPLLYKGFVTVLLKAYETGDARAFDIVLTRIIGKEVEPIDLGGSSHLSIVERILRDQGIEDE